MKVRTINPDVKAKWVAALRSGQHIPGKRALKVGKRYDVIGVLCDISGLGTWEKTPLYAHDYYVVPPDRFAFVPTGGTMLKWLDWDTDHFNPPVRYKNQTYFLTELNDEKGLTFQELAAIIEEQL